MTQSPHSVISDAKKPKDMKSILYHRLILITAALILASGIMEAQKVERNVTKNFTYNPGTSLNIDAKFGNVNILESDDNTVVVEANIWVESDNEKLAKELAESLDAEISASSNDINVTSVFPPKLPSRNNTKFGIDFTIHAPAGINLSLDNKYGAVYLEKISGLAHIEVSYGTLKAQSLIHGRENDLNEVILNYSTGTIDKAGWMKINLAYSKLSISEAKAVVALSMYSGLVLDECSSIVVESKYDIYKIGEIKNYVGDLKYSNLSADEISEKFEISSSYSNVKIGEIGVNFKNIKIDNMRGSYKIGINAGASFTIKGEAIRGDIAVSGVDNLSEQIENADKYISGRYGSNPKANVNITVKEGKVRISVE